MEAIKKTLAATANVSMNREASLRRYFEDRPGRGSSLRTHLPPGLDKRGEVVLAEQPERLHGSAFVDAGGTEATTRVASPPFVGEGGAATSPGQAVGAGTASPLRRIDREAGGRTFLEESHAGSIPADPVSLSLVTGGSGPTRDRPPSQGTLRRMDREVDAASRLPGRARTVSKRSTSRIIPEIRNAIPGEVCWLCGKDATVVIGGLMWSYCEDCGANRLSLELAVAIWRVVKDTWASERGGP